MAHDTYFVHQPDCVTLAKELDNYIAWIEECLQEDCTRDSRLDMEAQRDAAKVVRANIRRVYDE